MLTLKPTPGNIDAYCKKFSKDTQQFLAQLRATIMKYAPGVIEQISYGMPAFKLNSKPLVYFAAYKNHIGFYPGASPIKVFKNELKDYKTSKGTIQFSLDKPLPQALVKKIVKYKVKENKDKAMAKLKKKK